MSRNLWLNLSIALALILIAAFAGRLHKWNWHRPSLQTSQPSRGAEQTETDPGSDESDSSKTEILVRFRSNVSRDAIANITSRLNDEVEDRIEAVDGLDVIEDEDNRSADEVL